MAAHNNQPRQFLKKPFRLTLVEKMLILVIVLQLADLYKHYIIN